jgi:hypothetical protein
LLKSFVKTWMVVPLIRVNTDESGATPVPISIQENVRAGQAEGLDWSQLVLRSLTVNLVELETSKT